MFLKPVQLVYQLWYRLKAKWPIKKRYGVSHAVIKPLQWKDGVFNLETFKKPNTFSFLNITKTFETRINWNFDTHKKLWTYNLNYFDFLNQASMTKTTGLELIQDYIINYYSLKDGKEPYPTSLRIINWVKFIAKHNINDESINSKLKEDANRLCYNLEYHLLANHLLENGFALWFAAHLFDEARYYKIASKILKTQLEEQILKDGGHFELSPMYHNLMLYRVLDCIQLAELNKVSKTENHVLFLRDKASKMISWSQQMTFSNGDMALFNDAANGINPVPFDVMTYAEKLQVKKLHLPLKDSGYRAFKNDQYELFADVGQVGPTYQPGHAHADTFSFELYVGGNPLIVDTGTSTYNIGKQRSFERSTKAHNTVVVNKTNSTQVWSGFRVAKRAEVDLIIDKFDHLKGRHDGYQNFNIYHEREWSFEDNQINILDLISKGSGVAYFHFHPKIEIKQLSLFSFEALNSVIISFKGADKVDLKICHYALEFNYLIPSKVLRISFKNQLETRIELD